MTQISCRRRLLKGLVKANWILIEIAITMAYNERKSLIQVG